MLIKNGIVFSYFPHINGEKLDIRVKNGVITKISKNINPHNGEEIIDARNRYLIPGIVDIHSHLRTPGFEYKEDFRSGSMAAGKGGITTLVAMPNTYPPLDNPKILVETYRKIEREASVEILLSSTITKKREGKELVDFKENKRAGCVFFTDDGNDINDIKLIEEICKLAGDGKFLIFVHPETHSLTKGKFFNKGELDDLFKREGQPPESESHSIMMFSLCGIKYCARIHFTHISSKIGVEILDFLKRHYGNLFTCDITPHHLILNDRDLVYPSQDPNRKVNPPLRSEADRIAIESALKDGVIDCIASDHAPHSLEEKNLGLENAPPGTIGFETMLPSTFTFLVRNKKIKMLDWIKLISYNPSKIIGLRKRGGIGRGFFANLVIFNPEEEILVNDDFLVSKSKNSAFKGMKFYGKIYYTLVKGKIIYKA